MNLLRRLRLGSGGLSLLGCSRSSSIGSQRSLSSCVAAGAKKEDPRWAMINYSIARRNDSAPVAAKSTTAESRTSTGRHLRVSLGVAPPPASSFFYYDWPGSDEEDSASAQSFVLAAHGDSALLNVRHKKLGAAGSSSVGSTCDDYFVYTAGAANKNKPPSLILLPDHVPDLSDRNTGLLRRGEDELLVAKLDLERGSFRTDAADMWVHRLGGREWELKRHVPIVLSAGDELPSDGLDSYAPVPVGDRFMCWFDYSSGIVVCDMAAEDESLKLRYVPLPVADDDDTGCGPNDRHTWDICAAGDRAVRFVTVDPRCYCNRDACPNDHNLFAVRTWTLALTTEEEEKKKMAWVKESTLDCEEIWAHPEYQGLPRTLLDFPVVSAADPDVACFMVCEDKETWMVQVNTRKKAVLSTVRWTAKVTHGAWQGLDIPGD